MAIQTKETQTHIEPHKTSEAKQTAEKGVKSLQAFWTKCNNDWVMNFASGLAFNLITAIFPIAIAIIAIAGFIFGSFDPSFQGNLIHSIENVFPQQLSSGHILEPALTTLSKNAGFLSSVVRVSSFQSKTISTSFTIHVHEMSFGRTLWLSPCFCYLSF